MPPSDISSNQVKILQTLFLGRKDAYGLETPTGPIAVREPITDILISDHLEGKKRIGRYPIFDKGLVQWAVIDIDQDDKDLTSRVYLACLEENFFPYLEKSKSKGFHNWLFFDEPLQAREVRKALSKLLAEINIDCEVFPKQDSLTSDNGLGNFVYLPLHGLSAKNGRTLFLNSQFQPYENQLEFLSKVHRTKTENILSLADKIPDEPKREHQKPESLPEGSLDLAKYLIHYNIPFKIKQDGSRTFYFLNRCLFADNHTTKDNLGDSSIVQDISGKITYQCFHGHCKGRTWADARKMISGDDSLSQFCNKSYSENKQGRNLTEDFRMWIDECYGAFTIEQIYKDLGITNLKDKNLIRVNIHREVENGVIEKGQIMGSYRKIDQEADRIEILETVPTPLPIKLPGEIETQVQIYPGNVIINAGSVNAGKTAYDLNVAYDNRDIFEVIYWSSEMADEELTLRTDKFNYPLQEWKKIEFKKRTHDFHQVIKADAFNVIDYLEVTEGEFFRIGDNIRKVFEKLNRGIALISLQMDTGGKFAWGGQKTLDKARLYITLDQNKLTIVKGKNRTNSAVNPNGLMRPFKLINGSKFLWEGWERAW